MFTKLIDFYCICSKATGEIYTDKYKVPYLFRWKQYAEIYIKHNPNFGEPVEIHNIHLEVGEPG
jgi:hypothetical protein